MKEQIMNLLSSLDDEVLEKIAKLLKGIFDALIKQGFTEEQAFKLMEKMNLNK